MKYDNTFNRPLFGRVTNKLDQTGAVILSYQFDADNRLTNRWSAAKGNTGYSYDAVGNLTQIAYPVSPYFYYQYDPLNRLTNMVDAVGTTVYTYTSGGELFTEDGPFASDTVTNTYSYRQRTGLGLQQPTGRWTNQFNYDSAKRLYNVISPAGTFTYTYDSTRLRLVDQLGLPNGSHITNRYDGNARLLGTWLVTSGSTVLDAATYGYNAGNQRSTYTNAAGAYVAYNYDPLGQLAGAVSSVSGENRGYAYDGAWNLSNLTNNGVSTAFNVDGKNQLSSAGTSNFAYDTNGNLTVQWSGSTSNIYAYDDENRLVSVVASSGSQETTFTYDGLGRLRKQLQYISQSGITNGGGGGSSGAALRGGVSPNTGTGGGGGWTLTGGIEYIYDGNRVIQERDTNNTPTVSYTRGNDLSGTLEGAGGIGGLLARSGNFYSGNFTNHNYYHADGNGNITYLETASQGLAASYRYDPYGNLVSSGGTLATTNSYRFSSKEYVSAAGTGFYYYLYRFYSPAWQRWLNRDPIGEFGGINLFQFVDNCPHYGIDPLGLAENSPPVHVQGPGSPNLPSPLLPDPKKVPPDYNPNWPNGIDNRGPYTQDPNGKKYWPDPENERRWDHYDTLDPNGKRGHYPPNCDKLWPTQTKPPYDHQSPTDPWNNIPAPKQNAPITPPPPPPDIKNIIIA